MNNRCGICRVTLTSSEQGQVCCDECGGMEHMASQSRMANRRSAAQAGVWHGRTTKVSGVATFERQESF